MTIEWLLFVGCLVWITGLALFLPEMFAPRCPICGSILEQCPAEHAGSWNRWNLGWIKFFCNRCAYFHRRPVVFRDSKVTKYEVRTVR